MPEARPDATRPLSESDVAADPVEQFTRWFDAAAELTRFPEAVALSTCGTDGRPSSRIVLLKGWDASGFVFYTNYGSRKGVELAANPWAALLAYFDALGRQVRVEGPVATVGTVESDAYFATRPRGSQLSAWASAQSTVIESRAALEARVAAMDARFEGRPVPRPSWWGGYRLAPEAVEFWQNREDRLHDRLRYGRHGDGWRIERLAP